MPTPTNVVSKWIGDLKFDALVTGHHVIMDAEGDTGGQGAGSRPKALILASITGCSGMDIVSILKKMKVQDYSFEMEAEGQSTTEHPIVYHTITVSYKFTGENLPPDKIKKAVDLSNEKYCGATEMLRHAAKIVIKIYINGKEIKE